MTNTVLETYLNNLENECENLNLDDLYLWKATPVAETLQHEIKELMHASDWDVKKPRSRSYKMTREIKNLLKRKKINKDFSLMDITCGDAVNLIVEKKMFPEMNAYGVDCLKDKFVTHEEAQKSGIKIFKIYLQNLFKTRSEEKFDIAVMLNTYYAMHNWDSKGDEDLHALADAYFMNNFRYTILTVSLEQYKHFKDLGFNIKILGDGEAESIVHIIMSKEDSFDKSPLRKLKEFLYIKLSKNPRVKLNILGIKLNLKKTFWLKFV